MDFSQTFYGGAHPYHFIGIPPLTPSHSNSAASDEFNNHSPHVSASLASFPVFASVSVAEKKRKEKKKPKKNGALISSSTQQQDVYDNFQNNEHFPQNFEPYAPFNHQPQAFPGPPGPPTPPTTHPMHGQNGHNQSQVNTDVSGVVKGGNQADILPMTKADPDANRQTASNSDDDDLTPAQSRRKAQNRAA